MLAQLLTDEVLSESARFALESMPLPEAGQALRDALPRTTGLTRVGILDSLGERREPASVAAIKPLLEDTDARVVSSAACALGMIGGQEALAALTAARAKAAPSLKPTITDAILWCADGLLKAGDAPGAKQVYRQIYESESAEHLKTAAYRGIVLSSGGESLALIESGLTGRDMSAALASLQLARQTTGEAATKALARALPNTPPPVQAGLIVALAQRGDPAAGPAVLAAAQGNDPAVRTAALRALGFVGDASAVPLLADVAAVAGPEQEGAREGLLRLRGADVRAAMLAHMTKAAPPVKIELIRALGRRAESEAAPDLLKLAAGSDVTMRTEALAALSLMADARVVPDLAKVVVGAGDDAHREEAERALSAACARSADKSKCLDPLVAAMNGASMPARCALLRVVGTLGGEASLKVLRPALKDPDASIRDAAIRAIASSPDPAALPELLGLLKQTDDLTHRVLVLRGCVRLAESPAVSAEQKLQVLNVAVPAVTRPEDKKLVLGLAAKVADERSLQLIEPWLGEAGIQTEAVSACWPIVQALAQQPKPPAIVIATCRKIVQVATDRRLKADAQAILNKLSPPGR